MARAPRCWTERCFCSALALEVSGEEVEDVLHGDGTGHVEVGGAGDELEVEGGVAAGVGAVRGDLETVGGEGLDDEVCENWRREAISDLWNLR